MKINTLLMPCLLSASAFANQVEKPTCIIPASPTTCLAAPNDVKLPKQQIEIVEAPARIAICKAAPVVAEKQEEPKKEGDEKAKKEEGKIVRIIDKGGRVERKAEAEKQPENKEPEKAEKEEKAKEAEKPISRCGTAELREHVIQAAAVEKPAKDKAP